MTEKTEDIEVCAEISTKRMFLLLMKAQEIMEKYGILDAKELDYALHRFTGLLDDEYCGDINDLLSEIR